MRLTFLCVLFLVLSALPVQPAAALEGHFQADGLDLVLSLDDGRVFRGQSLSGATLVLGTADRDTEIRIDGVVHEGQVRGVRATFFRMSVRDRETGADKDLCEPDPDGERVAFAYPDGAGGFALTCTSGAEGKCILFGYFPWQADPAIPMRDLHRACTHMLRADYGGDDRPSTRNGTAVNVYDRFGIQHPDHAPGMAFEAAWGPDGAVCVAHPRIADNVSLEELTRRYPGLQGRVGPQACSEPRMRADPRALLFNESMLTWRGAR
ncbi:ADYC domain-containing protein [Microvirga sesbaniae]|uniref:ADYC domain-containing protein n=1 Tax=Microvirga sesbaniae TaxID=681392 RepID=UPI0021C84604|nr:ADYC domain-containing protein [Microvirga sp. HBU67692]